MSEALKARAEKYFIEKIKNNSHHSKNPFVTLHCQRYVHSILFIEQELKAAKSVLEVGGGSGVFTDGLKLLFPDLEISGTPNDLRTVFTDKVGYYDLLINMEVIEHIKDLDVPGDWYHRDAYVGDGLKNFVDTCYACLKPGGKMFLTTPNLSSLGTLWRVMQNLNPFSYELHIRELSITDLNTSLLKAGFVIDRYTTMQCYDVNRLTPEAEAKILSFLRDNGCQTDNREEVQFLIAGKPGLPVVS